MKKNFLALAFACAVLGGCASMQATKVPGTDLTKLKTFYVARLPADERGIEKLISTRLDTMGYRASSGAEPTSKTPVDAIVTYQDRWMWDLTMYMLKLSVQVRDGQSGAILANGESTRPSLQRKSPEGMVEEVLTEIFKQ